MLFIDSIQVILVGLYTSLSRKTSKGRPLSDKIVYVILLDLNIFEQNKMCIL